MYLRPYFRVAPTPEKLGMRAVTVLVVLIRAIQVLAVIALVTGAFGAVWLTFGALTRMP